MWNDDEFDDDLKAYRAYQSQLRTTRRRKTILWASLVLVGSVFVLWLWSLFSG